MQNNGTDGKTELTGIDFNTLLKLGDNVPGGFFIYRADGDEHILYKNRAVLDIFGCRDDAEFTRLTGDTFRGVVYPDDYEEVESSIKKQIQGSADNLDSVQYRIKRADGEVRWIDDYGRFASVPGTGDVFYVFIWDVTERLLAEAEKNRVELELEKEKKVNEIKSGFIFNLSHDIRTPMNAIVGFSDLACRHMDDPALVAEYLAQVKKSGSMMLAIIDDMLEMNMLDSSKFRLKKESTDITEQINEVCDIFGVEIKEKRLTLIRDIDLPEGNVETDALRFRRILGNLLSNAVRFTPEGGTITVSAHVGAHSDSGYSRYVFSVADTGVGMSEKFMEKLFVAFEREATSTESGNSGTGLGLSIVRAIVRIMGGSVRAESKKGEGSKFTFELPLKAVAAEEVKEQCVSEPVAAVEGARILLVEDIEINRMLAEAVLGKAGFSVTSVPDGCDAVDAFRESKPGYFDLILMDIQMPVMNGYEATRAIRALGREDSATVPIVALSANTSPEDMKESIESGMNDHFAKPFDAELLIASINARIEENRNH